VFSAMRGVAYLSHSLSGCGMLQLSRHLGSRPVGIERLRSIKNPFDKE
jgi:hypothetical protein